MMKKEVKKQARKTSGTAKKGTVSRKPVVSKNSRKRSKPSSRKSSPPEGRRRHSGEKPLPGYPHYPQTEDILNPASGEQRLDADVEALSQSRSQRNSNLVEYPPTPVKKETNPDFVPGTEADVTPEDIEGLGDPDKDLDGGEDEWLLPKVKMGPDLWGEDLDVPGAELDDDAEDIGSEDEENNYYSRGQD